jgi:hypothetical protein
MSRRNQPLVHLRSICSGLRLSPLVDGILQSLQQVALTESAALLSLPALLKSLKADRHLRS